MNKITNNSLFIKILALFFALLLFFNANSDGGPIKITGDANLAAVAEKVPIRLKYDENKYYVAGYEETTTVYLKSANKVLLDIETNEQTRNFKLEADLSKFSEGTYEVPLSVTNLNQVVEATLKDKTIHIRIEKRETRSFNVEPRVNDNLLKNGYSLENIVIDPPVVEITSGDETLNQIEHVIASLDDDRDLSADLSKRVDVIALDKEGNVLSVIIVPTTVSMTVHIEAPSKSVPLKITQSGSIPTGIKAFEFSSSFENVTISGPREAIDKVTELEVFIDTSKISETTEETVTVTPPENIVVNPLTVAVKITAIKSEKEATKASSNEQAKTVTSKPKATDTSQN